MKLILAILIIFSCVIKFGIFTTTSASENNPLELFNDFRRSFAIMKNVANMYKLEWNETFFDQEQSKNWSDLYTNYRKGLFNPKDDDSKDFMNSHYNEFYELSDAEARNRSYRTEMFTSESILPAQKMISCKNKSVKYRNYTFLSICILGPEGTFDSYKTSTGPAGSRCPKGYFNDTGLCARKKEVQTTPITTRIQKATTTKKVRMTTTRKATTRLTPAATVRKASTVTTEVPKTSATKTATTTTDAPGTTTPDITTTVTTKIPMTSAPTTEASTTAIVTSTSMSSSTSTSTSSSTSTFTSTSTSAPTTTSELQITSSEVPSTTSSTTSSVITSTSVSMSPVPTTTPELQTSSSTTSPTTPTTSSTPPTPSTTFLSSPTTSTRPVRKVHRPVVVVDKEAVLHEFNEHRRKFAKERRISRMFKLTWDDSLAQLAQTGSPSNYRVYYDNPDLEGIRFLNDLFQEYQGHEGNLKTDSKNEFLGYHEYLLPGQKRIGCAARHVKLEKGNFHSICLLAPELNFDGYGSSIGDPGSDCPDGFLNDDGLCSSGKESSRNPETKKSESEGTPGRLISSEELDSLENRSTDSLNFHEQFLIFFFIFVS